MGQLKIIRNAELQTYNSLAVPAQATHLAAVGSLAELKQALVFAGEHQLPILVLGEGSNTVLSKDFSGLVILNRLRGIDVVSDMEEFVELVVAAGENWHTLVAYTVEHGWSGLENLALIPGLVGAAPIQNIGAYGVEVKDTIVAVECLDRATGEPVSLTNDECEFAYRDSIFKRSLNDKLVITAVRFRLSKNTACNLSYPALAAEVGEAKSPLDVFKAVCDIRARKLPSPKQTPNVGSFFKNPVVSAEQHKKLRDEFPELVSFAVDGSYKLAAAWLIDKAGWKQKAVNGVQVHQKQALVICNPQRRSGSAILNYAKQIQADILSKFGVELEIEPRIY
ncbi:UDP-N-acetylmuramate dehydrogenase [Arenicella xantha]|uniref:UDP-N-acetylenolpyruvoylglucosamine reductase n=1 Tax=Arenicella xantha TaxID=644221 RepID=A0A395JNL6_9GAMM|nr:UDP-N-acetylmuramate dehydrogenase [Arenicella xantha]RBP53241.1 UDP-N-acetylmuramate dehydrogenase [Arenicella xantha]